MTAHSPAKWLIMLLGPELSLSLAQEEPPDEFTQAGSTYRAIGWGEIVATFDRLITESGRWVGIQVWPVGDEACRAVARVRSGPHIVVNERPPFVQVYFVGLEGAGDDVASAGDQSLVGGIYVSQSDSIGVAVDISELVPDAEERSGVPNAERQWPGAAPP